MPPSGLHAALVLSTKPHAHIISIDASEAISVAGFEGFFTAKDIPGSNNIGAVIYDEELFASNTVTCVGQVTNHMSLLKSKLSNIVVHKRQSV